MKKKLLSLFLCLCLSVSLLPAALAVQASPDTRAATLAALDIMVGDENGNLNLNASVTRAEFVKMAIAASVYKDSADASAATSPFYDVPRTHWAAGYIAAAVDKGLVKGYLDGLFRPDATITLEEGVTILLRLLGYSSSDFTAAFPISEMATYRSIGLDEGVSASQGQTLTRSDAQILFYNLLTTDTKTGVPYLTTLGHALNAAGEIDLVSLINSAMEGPVTADASWQSRLTFTPSASTAYYRNGSACTAGDIAAYDVLYWSKSMNTVWAYSNKVTGAINAVSPSASNPSAVTVAGKTYAIETAGASLALSSLGSYKTGDVVTLLLGRDGAVAGVTSVTTFSTTLYGMVTATGSASYTDENGHSYTARTVTLTATDGASYSYPTDLSLSAGTLVKVVCDAQGSKVTQLTRTSLTGRVTEGGVGNYTFADDVEILDTYKSSALRVYPARLAGSVFASDDVRFYALNSKGEISHLILDDFTGDLHSYGILTGLVDASYGVSVNAVYTYDLAGTSITLPSSGTAYPVSKGPIQIKYDGGALAYMTSLKKAELTEVDGLTALSTAGTYYTLADNAAVYIYQDNRYQFSSLEHVLAGDYTLTGYYDNTDAAGGRIRVIIAK